MNCYLMTFVFQGHFVCVADEVESYGSEDADGKAIVRNFESCQKLGKGKQEPEPAPEVTRFM